MDMQINACREEVRDWLDVFKKDKEKLGSMNALKKVPEISMAALLGDCARCQRECYPLAVVVEDNKDQCRYLLCSVCVVRKLSEGKRNAVRALLIHCSVDIEGSFYKYECA